MESEEGQEDIEEEVLSSQKARGGIGSHKHGVSGTSGPNRRDLQALGRLMNKLNKKRKKPNVLYNSVQELMASPRKRRTNKASKK